VLRGENGHRRRLVLPVLLNDWPSVTTSRLALVRPRAQPSQTLHGPDRLAGDGQEAPGSTPGLEQLSPFVLFRRAGAYPNPGRRTVENHPPARLRCLAAPWLRVSRLLRCIRETRWSAEVWADAKKALGWALAKRGPAATESVVELDCDGKVPTPRSSWWSRERLSAARFVIRNGTSGGHQSQH
jgi:hypothetical protein